MKNNWILLVTYRISSFFFPLSKKNFSSLGSCTFKACLTHHSCNALASWGLLLYGVAWPIWDSLLFSKWKFMVNTSLMIIIPVFAIRLILHTAVNNFTVLPIFFCRPFMFWRHVDVSWGSLRFESYPFDNF